MWFDFIINTFDTNDFGLLFLILTSPWVLLFITRRKQKKGWSFLKQIIKQLRFKRIDASESEPFYILFYICAAEETKTVYDKLGRFFGIFFDDSLV